MSDPAVEPIRRERPLRSVESRPTIYMAVADRLQHLQRRLGIVVRGERPGLPVDTPPRIRDSVEPAVRTRLRVLTVIIDQLPAFGAALGLRSQDVLAMLTQQAGAFSLYGVMQSLLLGCADGRRLTAAGHRLLHRCFLAAVEAQLRDPTIPEDERAAITADMDEIRALLAQRAPQPEPQPIGDAPPATADTDEVREEDLLGEVIDALRTGDVGTWRHAVRKAEGHARRQQAPKDPADSLH